MDLDKTPMARPLEGEPHANTPEPPASERGFRWYGSAVGMILAVGVMALAWVFFTPLLALFEPPEPKGAPPAEEPVAITSTGLIVVSPDNPLAKRLQIVTAQTSTIRSPVLSTTGYVIARLAPGPDLAEARWDFASTEISTAYADWLNARADRVFTQKQAAKTRELVKVRLDFLKSEWERKEKGFLTGAVPERDRVVAKADYLQADIQGQKDITDAETASKKAERSRGLLERQLFQVGVDPEVVRKATEGLVLVVADVPEAKIQAIKVGQPCDASFFAVPGKVFHDGRVGRMGPSVSKEKRTLRVTFELTDTRGLLRPGMFADIGLDTEIRHPLVVPADAALHIGSHDYVLREESPGRFRAIAVRLDEPHVLDFDGKPTSCVVIKNGLNSGDHVVAAGAILLKPVVAKYLASQVHSTIN